MRGIILLILIGLLVFWLRSRSRPKEEHPFLSEDFDHDWQNRMGDPHEKGIRLILDDEAPNGRQPRNKLARRLLPVIKGRDGKIIPKSDMREVLVCGWRALDEAIEYLHRNDYIRIEKTQRGYRYFVTGK